MRSLVWFFCVLALVGCSSKSKKSDHSKTEVAQADHTAQLTRSVILDQYSLLELNAAGTVLRAVSDRTEKNSKQDEGTELVGCPITGAEARQLLPHLQSLIDAQSMREREVYVQDPSDYAKGHSFETCASSCSCGVFASAFDGIDESEFKKGNPKINERYLSKLKGKARLQDKAMTEGCARNHAWFCKSDLKTFLEKENASNPHE